MVQNLLFVEIVLKGIGGVLLLLFPRSLARVLGLPSVGDTFWPRLLGALLMGLGVATFLDMQLVARNGLGLAGLVAINLATMLAVIGMLIMGRAGPTRRGRAAVILAIAVLAILSLFELAWI
jgi:hypothetical protein